MDLRRLLGRLRLWRVGRRGEAVVDAEMVFDGFATLADDLIPGQDFEIPRDLFGILAFCWVARADRGARAIIRSRSCGTSSNRAWLASCSLYSRGAAFEMMSGTWRPSRGPVTQATQ